MKDVSPNTSTIRLTGTFGGFTPRELFDYWVKPELLAEWWPKEAIVVPEVGGSYVFSWPEQDWHVRGTYTAFEPGKHLAFTWSWDHDPIRDQTTQVDLAFEEIDSGAQLTIEHGPWGDSQVAQDDRNGTIEGWIHFGMRLAGLRSGEAT